MLIIGEAGLSNDMEAFPDWGPLDKDSATKLKKGRLNVCTVYCVYGVLFSPLWLKFVPGWPAISVSS
jgi:hypothetical protein